MAKKSKSRIARLNMQATQKVRSRDFRGAIVDFKEVLKMDSQHKGALQMISQCFAQTQNAKEAIKFGERAVKVDPTDFTTLRLMADIHIALGEKKKSRKYEALALVNPPVETKFPVFLKVLCNIFFFIPPVRRFKHSRNSEIIAFNDHNTAWLRKIQKKKSK